MTRTAAALAGLVLAALALASAGGAAKRQHCTLVPVPSSYAAAYTWNVSMDVRAQLGGTLDCADGSALDGQAFELREEALIRLPRGESGDARGMIRAVLRLPGPGVQSEFHGSVDAGVTVTGQNASVSLAARASSTRGAKLTLAEELTLDVSGGTAVMVNAAGGWDPIF